MLRSMFIMFLMVWIGIFAQVIYVPMMAAKKDQEWGMWGIISLIWALPIGGVCALYGGAGFIGEIILETDDLTSSGLTMVMCVFLLTLGYLPTFAVAISKDMRPEEEP